MSDKFPAVISLYAAPGPPKTLWNQEELAGLEELQRGGQRRKEAEGCEKCKDFEDFGGSRGGGCRPGLRVLPPVIV